MGRRADFGGIIALCIAYADFFLGSPGVDSIGKKVHQLESKLSDSVAEIQGQQEQVLLLLSQLAKQSPRP